MADQTIDLSAGVVQDQPASQDQGGIDLSAGVLQAPSAPVNPYASQGESQSNLPTVSAAPQPGILSRLREGVANSPIGRTLETYAPSVAGALDLAPTESESARQQDKSTEGQWLEYHPVQSLKQMKEGAENIVEGTGYGQPGTVIAAPGGVPISMPGAPAPGSDATGHKGMSADQAALGGTQVMSGAMGATKPLAAAGIAAAPFRAAAMYGAGILAGDAAQDVAAKMGATPNEQEFFKTGAFFIPDAIVKASGFSGSLNPEVGRLMDPATGEEVGRINLRGGVVGGRGFAAGVAKGEPGQYQGAVRVGPYSARVNVGGGRVGVDMGRHEPGQPLFGSPEGAPPQPGAAPQAPPDPTAVLASQQAATIKDAAVRAADTEKKAAGIAAGVPPPKPPSVPAPAGMDQGALTLDTVGRVATAIRMLPSEQQAPAVLEATGNLAKWLFDKKTVVGPDGKVLSIDSPKAAQSAAVKIINDEVERQSQAEQQAHQQKQQQIEQGQKDADTARQEQEASLEPAKKGGKTAPPAPEIPDTPHVQHAKSLLQVLPEDATAARMDQHLRDNIMLPTPVRKELVAQEVSRRAQAKETAAQEAMTGTPTPAGQKPEEIDRWVEGVKKGDEPFAHVQEDTTYRPKNVDGLARTAVKGAPKVKGEPSANGIYFHDPEITGAEIRKAARDGKLDELRENWKKGKDETQPEVVSGGEQENPAEAEAEQSEAAPRKTTPFEGIEGKKTMIHLADGSSIPATHMMVERTAIHASHLYPSFEENPVYPPGVQERSYHKSKDEQMKVHGQIGDFKPELIVNTDPTAQTGSPIVTSEPVTIDGQTYPAGTVIGGNSRALTLEGVYTNGAEGPYHEALGEQHRSFGFPPEGLEHFGQPVHVRAVKPPKSLEEMHRLGSLLNKTHTQSLDAFDQAVSLGKQLSPDTLEGIADAIRSASDGDSTATLNSVLTDNRTGRQIVKMLERDGIITDRNRGSFVDPSTLLLTAPARTQLGNAILANLLDSRDLMEKTPAFLKNRLLGAIGSISSITAQDDGWNLAPAMREAAKQYGELHRQTGIKPSEALSQQGMFGDERGPVVEALIKAYDKSVGEVRKSLGLFSIGAQEGRNPTGLIVGLTEPPDPYLDFNFAFGTELTKEQFDAEMGKLRNGPEALTDGITQTAPATEQQTSSAKEEAVPAADPATAPQGEILAPEGTEQQPFKKGDQVVYITNGGKRRAGEIQFSDGRIARIKDAKTGTVITKKLDAVERGDHFPGTPSSVEGENPQVTTQLPAKAEGAQPQNEKPQSLIGFMKAEIADGGGPTNYNELKYLAKKFDGKDPDQLRMKQVQEAYEAAQVDAASNIAFNLRSSPRRAFDELVKRYENQPSLSIRTSTSIQNQAYSTPAPLAFVVDKFAGIRKGEDVYEPTAGNGMLLLGVPPGQRADAWANELNGERGDNLKEIGFSVSNNDASKWTPNEKFDAIVANPPFGALPGPVEFDGYKIVKLEHLIALKALSCMKDDGRASVIIGASKEPGEVTAQAKPFFNYLYSRYNVVADFELDGDLYSRQGASWPVRVIAVDGRARSTNVCPPASEIERLTTWEGVYEKASQHLGSNLEGQRRADVQLDGGVRDGATDRTDVSLAPAADAGIADRGRSEAGAPGHGNGLSAGQPGPIQHTGGVPTHGVGDANNVVAADGDVAQSDRLAEDQPRGAVVAKRTPRSDPNSGTDALTEGGNQYQAPYQPHSEKKDVDVLAPRGMLDPMRRAMQALEDRVGDIDQFVVNELGYNDVDTMQEAFMGLQVDTIAAGIDAVQRNRAVIIADQTGVGKGRQGAAIIRWAELHGHIPIFVTAKDQLFTATYADLIEIGSGDTIKPLLMNADAEITHPVTEQKIFKNKGTMTPVLQRILETGKLPEDKNALFLTYSQVNKPNRQQLVLSRLAPNAVFILDESHNAGGESNTGNFMRGVLDRSRFGTVFLSATWAKRPDNLPIYASKTDIGLAITDKDKIVSAIKAGGAPLQAVLSHQLTEAGQHFRREKSFDGITFPMVVMKDKRAQHEAMSDKVTEVLRAIVEADHLYHELDFEDIKADKAAEGMTAGAAGNNASKTVNHMEFSSIVHNLVRQFLLGLKVDEVADRAIQDIRDDKKPIIVLENTMGSFLDHYAEANGLLPGAPLHNFTYGTVLKRALDRTRYYKLTDDEGKETRVQVELHELSEPVRAAYDHAEGLIRNLTVDVPVSPIDWMRQRFEDAGFRVAEITGRTLRVDYSREVPVLSKVPNIEKKDRVATALGFNNGGIDALIMNTAGSTGISLHASVKFRDQRTRKMYVAQPFADINQFMQALGRNNRTGQVRRPEYELPVVDLPAEARPAMVLSKKMKSLNANTTSNTRSAVSVESPDMMNKYGDKVVEQYLAENPDMAAMLHMHVNDDDASDAEDTEVARKAISRSALLPVKVQKEFMEAITEQYRDLIEYLDSTGQNDLEPKTYDFDARERSKQLIYRGTDPTSPFGQDASYGEYSIKHQGKPYTPEEVKEQVKDGLNGAANDVDHHRALVAELDKQYKPFMERQTAESARERAQQTRQGAINFMSTYRVGSGVRVEINGESYAGIITSIDGAKKPSGNPFAASSMKYTVALNGALRSVKVSGRELAKIAVMPLGQRVNVGAIFKDYNPDARQTAKIITGNLLAAFGALKGVKGRVISFTTSEGKNEIGILMPAKFDPAQHVSQEYAIRSAEGAQKFLTDNDGEKLQAPGGDVIVSYSRRGGLTIRTKMAKAAGGRFYKDQELLGLVQGGDFASSGGMMTATVIPGKGAEALRVIMQKIALYPTQSMAERARAADEAVNPKNLAPEPPKPTGGKMRELAASEEGSVDTQAAVEYAAKAVPATWNELVKFTKQSGKSAKNIGRELAEWFSPTSLADADALDIMGHATGEPALRIFEASQLLTGVKKMFEGMTPEQQVAFVDRWQTGRKQTSTDMQNAQDMMQSILEAQREREAEAVNLGRDEDDRIELTQRENYFPNRYSKAPGTEELPTEQQQVARVGGVSRRPFAGSKAFLKKQSYTLKQAVEKGAEPLGTPVDMMMRRLQEGAKFVAAQYAMHNFKEQGIVTFLRNGKKMPDGYKDIEDNIAKVWRPVDTDNGKTVFVQAGRWVGQQDAIRLLNNFLSKDWVRGTEIGAALVKLKTLTTEMRLALSPFHFGYITVENFASGLNLGLDKFYNHGIRNADAAKIREGIEEIGKAIIQPYTAVKAGGQMLKFAQNPDQFLSSPEGQRFAKLYPDFPHLQDLLFRGGMRWGMADTYKQSFGDGFLEALKEGELGKSVLKAVPWVAHALMKPLFEHYIPRSKWAFAVELLSQKLAQYSQALAAGTITEETIAREVAATTDNRFGELNWDSLYLHNAMRTGMQLAFRSATWKLGAWRGLVSAGKETFTSSAFDDRIFDKIDEEATQNQWMKDAARRLPQLGMNAGWILSMGIAVAVMGSAVSRLASGKWPWEWADEDAKKTGLPKWGAAAFEAMHPRSGHRDTHSEPIRISFPTGLKDYEHGIMEPGRYAKGSLADFAGNAWDTLQNRDAFGNYVYNPQDPAVKAFMQGAVYNFRGDFMPMSAENYARQYGPQDAGSKVARASGIVGGAPRFLDQSKALTRALSEVKHEAHTPEEEDAYRLAQRQPPTRYQVLKAARERNLTYLDHVVLHELNYSQAKDIFDNYANDQERQQLRPIMERKRTIEIMKARRTHR